jgi:hypothetical protein
MHLHGYAASIPRTRSDGWVAGFTQRLVSMKMVRNVLLALVAFTVLAGSVVPANAAVRHHKHHKHHKR